MGLLNGAKNVSSDACLYTEDLIFRVLDEKLSEGAATRVSACAAQPRLASLAKPRGMGWGGEAQQRPAAGRCPLLHRCFLGRRVAAACRLPAHPMPPSTQAREVVSYYFGKASGWVGGWRRLARQRRRLSAVGGRACRRVALSTRCHPCLHPHTTHPPARAPQTNLTDSAGNVIVWTNQTECNAETTAALLGLVLDIDIATPLLTVWVRCFQPCCWSASRPVRANCTWQGEQQVPCRLPCACALLPRARPRRRLRLPRPTLPRHPLRRTWPPRSPASATR